MPADLRPNELPVEEQASAGGIGVAASGRGEALYTPWLTYREAAHQLNISEAAVAARARRRKWPKLQPNRRGAAVRIQVPIEQSSGSRLDSPTSDNELRVRALDAAAQRLSGLVEQERLISYVERRDRLEAQRQTALFRGQLRVAQSECAAAQRRLVDAEIRVSELTSELDAARTQLGRRWWWFWRAW